MNRNGEVRELDCKRALGYLHRRLDGERLDAPTDGWLEEHLGHCIACRTSESELRQVQAALRRLPAVPLPDHALEQVWDRTTRASRAGRWFDWRAAAAAAVLALALAGVWQISRSPSPGVAGTRSGSDQQELAQASAEARFVLGLTARALRRGERAAIGEVMGRHVAPALKKIPLRLPGAPAEPAPDRKPGEDDV